MPLTNPIFRRISRLAEEQGVRAFVVGGYVRDHFLRRPSTDIDVVVVGSGIALAEALGRELHAKVSVFKTFGTAMLRHKGVEVEFVGARRESYTQDSRKPQVEAGTLEDDQRRRDFTINAMAWSLNAGSFGELVDPFDGMDDLEECVIRTPCDPDVTFSDDPLRMMRAVRFASQLGFTIEGETFDAIRRNAHRIRIVSRERIAAELNKIVLSPVPSMGFELLELTGLLELIFPEMHNLKGVEKRGVHAHKDNFIHTLKVLDNVARLEPCDRLAQEQRRQHHRQYGDHRGDDRRVDGRGERQPPEEKHLVELDAEHRREEQQHDVAPCDSLAGQEKRDAPEQQAGSQHAVDAQRERTDPAGVVLRPEHALADGRVEAPDEICDPEGRVAFQFSFVHVIAGLTRQI